MEKRTILALVLSAAIILGYQWYVAKHYPVSVGQDTAPAAVPADAETASGLIPAEDESASTNDLSSAVALAAAKFPEKEIVAETDRYVVTLSSIGGCIKNITLKYRAGLDKDARFGLIDITEPSLGIFNIEWPTSKASGKSGIVNFDVEENPGEVIFTANIGGKLKLEKKYIFHNSSYLMELEVRIQNISDSQIRTNYVIHTSANIGIDSSLDKRYIQAVYEAGGKVKKSGGAKGEGAFIKGNISYAGLQNKYFSVIVKNTLPTEGALVKKLADDNMSSGLRVSEFVLTPRAVTSHTFSLYAGPTDKKIMEKYGLRSAASHGFLSGVGDILLAALKLFHRMCRNWGVAIILLSVLVNLVLFPLSRKSYESMKKLQHIQPHMDKLRVEHKDNPQKMNKEMMELYKKHNVNPMGGCLPLLLQMPIFIALYQTLMQSLELRGARFLWVKDLSAPENLPIPFSLPLIDNTINILPILMTIAMVYQQKFSTGKGAVQSEEQRQQQRIMALMPVVFLFVMYSFPSGLVLYWLVNTVLTMFEQRAIMHSTAS